MKFLLCTIAAWYLIPFALVLTVELTAGPVTPALATLRAVVWPLYVTTGIPQGERAIPD
jgi:hypothetical protein